MAGGAHVTNGAQVAQSGKVVEEVRIWVDGALVAPGDPAVSPLDHGLTVGDGAFETCKVVDGRPFALTRHLARLDRSLAGLGLPEADRELVATGIGAVLGGPGSAFEPLRLGRLRVTVTGGVGPPGSDRHDCPPTTIVTAAPIPAPAASAAVVVVPWTRNERAATAGLKTTSYADNVVALAYARQRSASEAVFGNTAGRLCEGTGTNVFVVVDGQILTPPLTDGPLAGITRELVVQWCLQDGVHVREESLPLSVLDTADEVFVTSSTRDVQGVHAVGDRRLVAAGPVTASVSALFARRAAQDQDP